MIAKHIPMREPRRSDFAALVEYLVDTKGRTERLAGVRLTNCLAEGVPAATAEVMATQLLNTRAAGDRTYHLLISFPPGEVPEAGVLEQIEARLCAGLGFSEHQRISVIHHDTDHLHLHVAINKIHPERRTIHEPYRDYRTLGELCTALEVEHGLQRVAHAPRRRVAEGRAGDMELHSGLESLLGWIRRECLTELRGASSWAELHQRLAANGLELVERGNGLVVRAGDGTAVRASAVARDLSRSQLEARFGPYASATLVPGAAPERQYRKRPLELPNTEALYARYQAERGQHESARALAWEMLRTVRTRQVEAAMRSSRRRRRLIRVAARGRFAKRLLYAQASQALRAELRSIQKRHREERVGLTVRHPRRTWLDWLQGQARAGDAEALGTLRARSGAGLRGNTIAGGRAFAPRAAVDHVTKRGTLLYGAELGGVRDDGAHLGISREVAPGALRAALELARERSPARIDVQGTPQFREQIRQAAATLEPPIPFADPELQRRAPGRPLAAVAPREGEGDAAPRPAGLAAKATPEAAAAQYMAERDAARARGIEVPRHRLYAPTPAPLFYAGTRSVAGQTLVLLKTGEDEILILPVPFDHARRLRRLALGTRVTVTRDGVRSRGRTR